MTIDEAIAHALEVAERYDRVEDSHADDALKQECIQCAADHRQLAEWLTELKQWRRVYGVCPSYEMCIPECKEGYDAQIAEYKRLLKAAVEDIRWLTKWHDPCELCGLTDEDGDCPVDLDKGIDCDDIYKWRLEGEVEKLIGGEEQ